MTAHSDEDLYIFVLDTPPLDGLNAGLIFRAHRWQRTDPACPWHITAESWRREDGERLMALSIKSPAVQAAAAIGGVMAHRGQLGAEHDVNEQAKTRWARRYHAARRAARPEAAQAHE
jgi:hypothetical protein